MSNQKIWASFSRKVAGRMSNKVAVVGLFL